MIKDKNSLRCDENMSLLGGKVILKRDFIVENAYLQANDAAFAGGSLIEGIGNVNSDVDVYVITDRLRREREIDARRHFRAFDTERSILTGASPDAEVFLVHTVIPGERIKVDIEYRTWAEIHAMADLVRETFAHACESLISLTTSMDRRELAFIHRLYNSKTLVGNTALERLRDRIGIMRFKYVMYRWKASDYSVLLDMQGAWEDRDWIRCADMARENMVTQFHAYTHLCGNTSYNRKWIITYAKRLNVDQPLYNRYISLLTTSAGRSENELRAYILATIDFVDDIFTACSRIIREEPCYPSGPAALSAIDEYFCSEAGDYSENEIAYCKKAYGVHATSTRTWFR
jgi:hypothetical protein